MLVGLMGSGKSAVARRLAASMDAALLDTDKIVEDAAGRTPHGQPIELDAGVTGPHLRTAPARGASPPAATPTTDTR